MFATRGDEASEVGGAPVSLSFSLSDFPLRPIIYIDLITEMSTAAKLTLAGTTAGAIGIVIFVHLQQKFDQAASDSS